MAEKELLAWQSPLTCLDLDVESLKATSVTTCTTGGLLFMSQLYAGIPAASADQSRAGIQSLLTERVLLAWQVGSS